MLKQVFRSAESAADCKIAKHINLLAKSGHSSLKLFRSSITKIRFRPYLCPHSVITCFFRNISITFYVCFFEIMKGVVYWIFQLWVISIGFFLNFWYTDFIIRALSGLICLYYKIKSQFLVLKKSFFRSVSVQILYFRGSDDCVPHIVRHTTA